MVSLMQRRRAMMVQAASPTPPGMITFDDLTYGTTSLAAPYSQIIRTLGNHFNFYNRRRSYGISNTIDAADSAAIPAGFGEIFSVHQGDVIDVYLKNFTVTGTASNSPKLQANFRTSDNTIIAGFSDTDELIPISVGSLGDYHSTDTAAQDAVINNFRLYVSASGQSTGGFRANFDLEVYVNGSRII